MCSRKVGFFVLFDNLIVEFDFWIYFVCFYVDLKVKNGFYFEFYEISIFLLVEFVGYGVYVWGWVVVFLDGGDLNILESIIFKDFLELYVWLYWERW